METMSSELKSRLLAVFITNISDHQRLLVYDFVPNNTLYYHFHAHGRPVMEWRTRSIDGNSQCFCKPIMVCRWIWPLKIETYSDAAEEDVKRYERSYRKLPPAHKTILSSVNNLDGIWYVVNNQAGLGSISESNRNVRCIIRNIVRDWASEGGKERDQCYTPILEELDRLFPNRSKDSPPCCLVPGAGLGRLTLEISCLDNDQLRAVSFPDIHPASAGITEGFSMCGGDSVEVYSDSNQEGAWDAVVTCFFLDTAHNIVEYIEIISRILKDVWINLGPLLYHFADAYGTEDVTLSLSLFPEMSIELSLEDVMRVAFNYGFHLEHEKIVETTYTANPQAMMQNRYNAAFWTMMKKGMQ
ncbi:hypothetical protein IFM89_027290 [Coptis chinensis]|uniref:S-adenosyl-L-methionine-dependent methyltransferase n=1 Tax=Coptis chinensis TaxID=261450 RepID=A0A835HVT3_9MAGN|nr:hypothetical protein IFM89_027290 [Coptis chinensis]